MNALKRIKGIEKSIKESEKFFAPGSPTGGEYQFLLKAFRVMRKICLEMYKSEFDCDGRTLNRDFEERMAEK